MKLRIMILILFAVSFINAQKSPKYFVEKPQHNFGTIVEGEIVSHNFEIVNKGNADLVIEKVKASCGCTAAQPEKNVLKPNEKTSIKVEFNSKSRMGPQEKFIYIYTNDQVTPEQKLSFSCVIVDKLTAAKQKGKFPKLKLMKTSYDFGNVEEGKVVNAKLEFKNSGNDVLQIQDVKTSCGCTAALLSSKILKPGESGELRIDLDTANREGKLTRTITLLSNDPDQPAQTITLFVNIEKRKS